MAAKDTIVIGASAGGVESLSRLVSLLPNSLHACIVIVLHLSEDKPSRMAAILDRRGPLKAIDVEEGMEPQLGHIYVAPVGVHTLLESEGFHLVKGPKENGSRPSIDVLFRSAAHSRKGRVIAVLLSGLLDDGTLGMSAVKRMGGMTIAQDPNEAFFPDMPRNAIASGVVEHVLSLEEIALKLIEEVCPVFEDLRGENLRDPTEMNLDELQRLESLGGPSAYVCPDCGGTLFEVSEEGIPHYRCRVGHSYLTEGLSVSQHKNIEAALWVAMRAIKEHNDLLEKMANSASEKGLDHSAKIFRAKLNEGRARLQLLIDVFKLEAAGIAL